MSKLDRHHQINLSQRQLLTIVEALRMSCEVNPDALPICEQIKAHIQLSDMGSTERLNYVLTLKGQ